MYESSDMPCTPTCNLISGTPGLRQARPWLAPPSGSSAFRYKRACRLDSVDGDMRVPVFRRRVQDVVNILVGQQFVIPGVRLSASQLRCRVAPLVVQIADSDELEILPFSAHFRSRSCAHWPCLRSRQLLYPGAHSRLQSVHNSRRPSGRGNDATNSPRLIISFNCSSITAL